ncbi:hypothetical protein AAFF_G00004590 [Aldrovandia affinis]|uniref:Uncharacterized protein n=1 Tax=Aldrovandia affinis TaxID=143900 RepID=A0AAD7TDM7_9TELE|nr:hypothetical protein AAFF_G00004590 [Aldrovandia affinis]
MDKQLVLMSGAPPQTDILYRYSKQDKRFASHIEQSRDSRQVKFCPRIIFVRDTQGGKDEREGRQRGLEGLFPVRLLHSTRSLCPHSAPGVWIT